MRGELVKVITNSDAAAAAGKSKGAGLPNPAEFDDDDGDSEGHGDDYYAEMEQQRQTELMHEQDEQLDGVFRTVGNLRQQADDMGRELEEQAVMIGEIDTLADRVGGKLQSGMSRLKWIIKKNEGEYMFFSFIALHYFNLRSLSASSKLGLAN